MYSRGEQRGLSVSFKVHLLLPKVARILILAFKRSYFVCVRVHVIPCRCFVKQMFCKAVVHILLLYLDLYPAPLLDNVYSGQLTKIDKIQ